MSRIYKVCVVSGPNEVGKDIFAIKPYLDSFESFKEEIFIRKAEMKNTPFKLYYRGKCGHVEMFLRRFVMFQKQRAISLLSQFKPNFII